VLRSLAVIKVMLLMTVLFLYILSMLILMIVVSLNQVEVTELVSHFLSAW